MSICNGQFRSDHLLTAYAFSCNCITIHVIVCRQYRTKCCIYLAQRLVKCSLAFILTSNFFKVTITRFSKHQTIRILIMPESKAKEQNCRRQEQGDRGSKMDGKAEKKKTEIQRNPCNHKMNDFRPENKTKKRMKRISRKKEKTFPPATRKPTDFIRLQLHSSTATASSVCNL